MLCATPAASEPSVRNFCSRITRKRSSCSGLMSRKMPMRCSPPFRCSTADSDRFTGRGSPARVISNSSPWYIACCRICVISAPVSCAEDRKSVQRWPVRSSPAAPTMDRNARLAKSTRSSVSMTTTPSPIRRTTLASSRASPSSRECSIATATRSATMLRNR